MKCQQALRYALLPQVGDGVMAKLCLVDNVQFNGNIPPGISIDDITVNEDDGTATFTVTLSKALQAVFDVDWATTDGTAIDGSDYDSDSGTLTFAGTAGETRLIVINLINDTVLRRSK